MRGMIKNYLFIGWICVGGMTLDGEKERERKTVKREIESEEERECKKDREM